MTGSRWIVALAAIAVAIGLGYAVRHVFRGAQPEQCSVCRRVVHAQMRTIAMVNGRPRVFCCPACALSAHEQQGKPIRVTELTGFLTGARIAPNEAFIVRGSNVNMCARTQDLIDADKRPADIRYDRCAPSLLAFSRRRDAAEFARIHGGEVLRFNDIASAFSK